MFFALVAESSVHSPGTGGAKMLVSADGERGMERHGTIGGGAMELRVVQRATEILERQGRHEREPDAWAERAEMHHRRRLDPDDAEDTAAARSGMICAGRQTNLYAVLHRDRHLETAEAILNRLEKGAGGSWTLDSGGALGLDDAGLYDTDLDAARRLERDGESWIYRESLVERRRVAILGGGHCGQALARLMAGLGWHVAIWETRPALVEEIGADAELRRLADVHRVDDFRQAGPRIDQPELTPVVVMTTDVPNDVRALYGALADGRPFPFVGAMGSEAKLVEIERRLRDLGLGDAELDRITAPVGLPVGSDTPPEIAVSVAAQLLRHRGRWLGGQ